MKEKGSLLCRNRHHVKQISNNQEIEKTLQIVEQNIIRKDNSWKSKKRRSYNIRLSEDWK